MSTGAEPSSSQDRQQLWTSMQQSAWYEHGICRRAGHQKNTRPLQQCRTRNRRCRAQDWSGQKHRGAWAEIREPEQKAAEKQTRRRRSAPRCTVPALASRSSHGLFAVLGLMKAKAVIAAKTPQITAVESATW